MSASEFLCILRVKNIKTSLFFRLPKFKAEIKTIGKLIIPRSIAKYFSSVRKSLNCSKNIFTQNATKSSVSFESKSKESTYTHCNRNKTQQSNQSSSKSIDPPNLVRLELISTCSTPTSTRRSKLFCKIRAPKTTKTKRYLTVFHTFQIYKMKTTIIFSISLYL